MIDALLKEGATVTAYDPEAMKNVKQLLGNTIEFAQYQYDDWKMQMPLIIATEWSEFRTPDFEKISSLLKKK